MMLRYSFDMGEDADLVEKAVEKHWKVVSGQVISCHRARPKQALTAWWLKLLTR
jgi:hypothetical protein